MAEKSLKAIITETSKKAIQFKLDEWKADMSWKLKEVKLGTRRQGGKQFPALVIVLEKN